ncbi:MAG TPA: phosphatase PAP2 family protein [Agriterribacter sp.]|nr:phosphatase PAP2 family protein [Agriterribacter sp.]
MLPNGINMYSKLRLSSFVPPVLMLIIFFVFLYSHNALGVKEYIHIQKDRFFLINQILGQYPAIVNNLSQLGDALIFLSFLGILIVYIPKIWESLFSALLVCLLYSFVLKNFFAVPRPAAVFDHSSFIIVGKTLSGHNSLPSGHSMTIFTILTVLFFALMPQKLPYKMLMFLLMVVAGFLLAFTRVGVGAHYPLDVILGSIIGYISGLTGIFISRKYEIWTWINNKKYYPVIVLLFLICCIYIVGKIIDENLLIFYFALASCVVTIFKVIQIYAKR